MVVQQVLLVAACMMSVQAYPPNPLLPLMRRRYGGGGGDYPTIKLPFPIPVKPSLLNKLEDVALGVLYDFRQLVNEEIRNSRTTTPAPTPPASLQQQIQDLQRKVDCKSDSTQDSPPIRASDSSLLGLSFKDDCVQIAIGGQKIFRRCGQAPRQRMFRNLPDSPTGAFSTTSVNHDSNLFMKNPNLQFPGNPDFERPPGKFPTNHTQTGAMPHNPNGPGTLPGNLNPSLSGPARPQNTLPLPPMTQHSPPAVGPIQNMMPPAVGPIQNMMPPPVGNHNQFFQPFNSKSRYVPPFDSKSWYPQPFSSKSWNMPPFDGKSWYMPPFDGKSWNMPPFDGKSWNMPPFEGKSWNTHHFDGKSWYQPPFGSKSWNAQPFYGQNWYQPPLGTKSWNAYPFNGNRWYPQMSEIKSWNLQQPLIQPHGFISPEKGGFHRHFHFGMEPPRPPPPPPPAGAPFDDPYYNKPFHFHKNPIQNTYINPPPAAPPVPQEPALPRRAKSIDIDSDDPQRGSFHDREINIPFPNSLKGQLSFPETDLSSVLAKAASLPRRSGDHDPLLVVAMPKEGDDARPGEFHSPFFIPLNFPKYDVPSDGSSSSSFHDEYMGKPAEMHSSSNLRSAASM